MMNRRMINRGGLAAMAWAAGGFSPVAAAQGLRMPDEGEPHQCTWMGLTSSRSIWGDDLSAVQLDLMRIADAVARFEPVVMLVNPDAMALAEGLRSRAVYKNHIRLVSAALDDLWLRDTGPVFVRAPDSGRLSAMDFNFNGWGNKQPHARDTQVAGWIADWAGVRKIRSRLVLEGGGLEVDGEGTAIIKESCVLNPNRNVGLDRAVVEQELRNRLGLTKVIWLPGPAGGDITDAHTDFYARFAGAGRVVVSHDEHDTYEERAVTQHHIDVLARATDAKGRPLSLTVIPVPVNPASSKANQDTFAAGYINYYLCNAGLIMPAFGDATADRGARQALQALHPDRHVVQMRIDAIAAGGGGIHCTTQQQPKV